jgi:aminoglycoside phosphotransferase (APT) family kinase protein
MGQAIHGGFVDEARPIRDGEALDAARLAGYLAAQRAELCGPLELLQFPKGHSNLTYLLRLGDRELVLRRPPFGTRVKTAHDMGREFRILTALQRAYPLAPQPLLYCDDPAVIGAPFYVMQRVHGVILRGQRLPRGLGLAAAEMRGLCTAAVDNLAALHAVDLVATALRSEGRPEGYVNRQISGWTARYFDAQTNDVAEAEHVTEWLAAHQPAERGAALIHGDYKYDNLVLDPADLTRIVAVLDWEMATVGDPLMDLGTSLGYWIDAADRDEHKMLPFGPTAVPGNLTRREVVARYAQISGRGAFDPLFYYVYGLFKIAVIAQQIYKRFADGLTKDPRFAMMIVGVRVLCRTAVRAIERDRIYDV